MQQPQSRRLNSCIHFRKRDLRYARTRAHRMVEITAPPLLAENLTAVKVDEIAAFDGSPRDTIQPLTSYLNQRAVRQRI